MSAYGLSRVVSSAIVCASRLRAGASGRDHDLEGLALVHRPVAVGHAVEADDAVEDAAGLDPAFENVRQQLLDVGADRGGAAAYRHVAVERLARRRHRLVLGNADAADRAARTRDANGRKRRLVRA